MEVSQRNGCLLTVAIALVLLVIVGSALTFILDGREDEVVAPVAVPTAVVEVKPTVEEVPDHVVDLREEAWPRYERRQAGAPLGIEDFVAARIDETSTNLTRMVFRENAEGAAVSWQMKAIDLYKLKGRLWGDFAVEYAFWTDGAREAERGSVTVRCEFVETTANELLDIRRGHLVTVEGNFSMKTNRPMILEAVLLRERGE